MASNISSTGAVCYLNLTDAHSNNQDSGDARNSNASSHQISTSVPEERHYSINRYLARGDQVPPSHPEYRLREPLGLRPQTGERDSRQESRHRMQEILGAIDAQLKS
ncbi:hypothetical protein NM208_g14665 [Fusarium decemcellulare]|uniref:Uncharacterized protein n=1 Tax=Fusarium decemcellulare TaxID=57161 RepID=A0ACC1RFV2_9HYPO|nr:hypothetical protein NM208_g14665 [Fusarium decemcellulare]